MSFSISYSHLTTLLFFIPTSPYVNSYVITMEMIRLPLIYHYFCSIKALIILLLLIMNCFSFSAIQLTLTDSQNLMANNFSYCAFHASH